jgi:YgiT-type zinc finger domain-containing protein
MNKVCNFCGNKNFKEARVQYIYRHGGNFLIVNDVPCEQCEFCGEQYFQAGVLQKIEADFQALQAHSRKAPAEILVPVESFA